MPLVELSRYYDRFAADVARSRQEADGIGAVLFDTEVWAGMGMLMPVRLMVLDEDADAARALLETPA